MRTRVAGRVAGERIIGKSAVGARTFPRMVINLPASGRAARPGNPCAVQEKNCIPGRQTGSSDPRRARMRRIRSG
jgi:hypothetical protein